MVRVDEGLMTDMDRHTDSRIMAFNEPQVSISALLSFRCC